MYCINIPSVSELVSELLIESVVTTNCLLPPVIFISAFVVPGGLEISAVIARLEIAVAATGLEIEDVASKLEPGPIKSTKDNCN